MIPRHPFEWLPASEQKWAFLALLVLTLAVTVSLNALNRPLKMEAAPSGIISFEFAGDLAEGTGELASGAAEAAGDVIGGAIDLAGDLPEIAGNANGDTGKAASRA